MPNSNIESCEPKPTVNGDFPVKEENMVQVRPYSKIGETQTNITLPNYFATSVKAIDFGLLREKHGTRVLFIDVDNTLTEVGSNRLDDPETEKYLRSLCDNGVLNSIYLATRSGRNLKDIEESIGAKRFKPSSGLRKPDISYFEALLQEANCRPGEAVMVGDRVTHDISGAEAAGMVTVLVKPIGKGILKGWILTDFLGIYQRERKARARVREELEKLGYGDIRRA